MWPYKRIHIHNSDKPWITPYIKNLISERQTTFAQSDSIKWRKLRNKVKREMEQVKVKYNAERDRDLQKTEPCKWHRRIKSMLNSTVSDLHMNIPGIDSNNHKDMANAINTQWRHQGGGGMGAFAPPVGSSPHLPPVRRKNGQNQPFSENFWIFAPSESHFAPSMPPQKIWCRHC